MAANAPVVAKVDGLAELRVALLGLAPAMRRRALRIALTAGARVFRDAAKRLAPILKVSTYAGASAVRRGVRKPGTLRNAIRVRTSKVARRAGDVGVFVNVRPAKGAARGAKNPADPFYWRFVEFGTKKKPGAHFLEGASREYSRALAVVGDKLGPEIQRLNQAAAKPARSFTFDDKGGTFS